MKDDAQKPIPENADLESLREAAADCKACDLWRIATQTVFGRKEAHAQRLSLSVRNRATMKT